MKDKILVTQAFLPDYEEYIEAIKPLWESHWITNMGKYHQELEKKLKDYLEVPNLSLMVNGHMALELTIQAMNFPKGSEIITTPFTFISTTHAIVRNDLKPVFCDIKTTDGTIDENKIEPLISNKTVAILPVHVYGNICNIEAIQHLAQKYHLKVIYDAAHAFGTKYKDKGIGNYGDASIFSFHATKIFNTIEGGAVSFQNDKFYNKLYNLKNFGIRNEESIVSVGANAKMNEFAAIMGLCNLKHITQIIKERESLYKEYQSNLYNIDGIRIFEKNLYVKSNYAYFPIVVEDNFPITRDGLYHLLRKNNYFARKYFYPLTSDTVCYQHCFERKHLVNARELAQKVLVLPFYEKIGEDNIQKLLSILKKQ